MRSAHSPPTEPVCCAFRSHSVTESNRQTGLSVHHDVKVFSPEGKMPKKFRWSVLGLLNWCVLSAVVFLFAACELAAQTPNRYPLFRKPTVSKTQIAFS